MMPQKCLNTPIEKVWVPTWRKLGKNMKYPYWILTPNDKVFSFEVADVCAKYHQNLLKMQPEEHRQTDR